LVERELTDAVGEEWSPPNSAVAEPADPVEEFADGASI